MTRRVQLNIVLAAVAILLATSLWLTGPEPPDAPKPLLDVAPQDIHRIEIHAAGTAEPIVLTRSQGQWRLASPVSARANENRINDLLAIAGIAPAQRYPAGEIDAKDAGLAQPKATLRFNNGPLLAIGSRAPLATARDKRYVRIGDTVALAAMPQAGLLDMGWTQWLDPHLLADDAELQKLSLPEVTLSRTDTGGWRVEPESRDQGADAAQFTVDTWRHALAISITAAADKPARATVKLLFADGRSRILEVIARQPEFVLRDPQLGVTYHLPASQAAPMLDMNLPVSTPSGDDADAESRQRPSGRKRTDNGRDR